MYTFSPHCFFSFSFQSSFYASVNNGKKVFLSHANADNFQLVISYRDDEKRGGLDTQNESLSFEM